MKKFLSFILVLSTLTAFAQVNRTYYDEIYLGDYESFPEKKIRYSSKKSINTYNYQDDFYENRIRRFHRSYPFNYSLITSFYYDGFYFDSFYDSPFVHSSFYYPYSYQHHHCAYYPSYYNQTVAVNNHKINSYSRNGIRGYNNNVNGNTGTSSRPNGNINSKVNPRTTLAQNRINSRIYDHNSSSKSVLLSTTNRNKRSIRNINDYTRVQTAYKGNNITETRSNNSTGYRRTNNNRSSNTYTRANRSNSSSRINSTSNSNRSRNTNFSRSSSRPTRSSGMSNRSSGSSSSSRRMR